MRRLFLPVLLLLVIFCVIAPPCAVAQSLDEEYYPYAEREERVPLLESDTALFYRAVQSADDLYGRFTQFNLPDVGIKRRGESYRDESSSVEGLALAYRYYPALRLLGAEERSYAGIASVDADVCGVGGVKTFHFSQDYPLLPYRAALSFSGRGYLMGGRFAATRELSRGWRGGVAVDLRAGRDLYVNGVFTDAVAVGFRLAKAWSEGSEFALVAVVPLSVRGTRLSSVEEAFELTGDRLYNPAWGYQAGKVRNSRVRRELVPTLLATYRRLLGVTTTFAMAAALEAGVERYSSPGWYDARTPMPDNYRYLPSFTRDRATEQAWRAGDARYTQLDWDRMIRVNRMAGGPAVYTLEDRVERPTNLHATLHFTTSLESRLTLHYGAYYRLRTTRHYRQMRDLLGADHILDIDQYLADDEAYSNLRQNDLRHPNRVIGTGDHFGYDYALRRREAGVRLRAEYRDDRLRADVDVTLGDAVVRRRGYYEKELFPGEGSLGYSRRLHFTPYQFKLTAGWAFSPRSYLGITAMVAAQLPEAEDLFYQPQYNNRTLERPTTAKSYAATVDYALTGAVVDLRATVFVTATRDEVMTTRYYDDLAGVYADMTVEQLERLSYGVEVAAGIRLSRNWRLSLAASAGRYTYNGNPCVTVLSDVDNTPVDLRAESYLSRCEVGGAPQLSVAAEVAYFGRKGWGARFAVGYVGRRWVEVMPLRRTERIARQGGTTPEAFAAFTEQERLRDAVTVDVSLFKTIYFERSQLTLSLLLRNLTDGGDTIADGYESLRIARLRAGELLLREPQGTRYRSVYPRAVSVTVSYRF